MDEWQAFVRDLFPPEIQIKRMFGGVGIFYDGVMFALGAYDELYLKVDEENKPAFEQAGSEPFIYEKQGKPMVMSYWKAPDEALESAHGMKPWFESALAAAYRSKKK